MGGGQSRAKGATTNDDASLENGPIRNIVPFGGLALDQSNDDVEDVDDVTVNTKKTDNTAQQSGGSQAVEYSKPLFHFKPLISETGSVQSFAGEKRGPQSYGYRDGFGIYKLSNGHVYEGCVKDGMKNGFGKFSYANGNSYVGHYIDDKRQGHGVFQYHHGPKYDGEWFEGEKHGRGIYIYSTGDRYEG